MRRSDLAAQSRVTRGKGGARKVRATGMIPGVMYGLGRETSHVSVNSHDLSELLRHGERQIIRLQMKDSDGETLTMVKEVERDPISENIIHVDFLRIDLDKPLHTEVSIHVVGDAPGVKAGGVIEHILRDVEIEARPTDIPDFITIDVSALDVGQSLHVSDMVAPPNVKILTDPHRPVVTVITPAKLAAQEMVAVEAAPVEGAEGVEGAAAEGAEGAEGAAAEGAEPKKEEEKGKEKGKPEKKGKEK